jgi:tetratricopeptide (TPR) repeat protein
VAHQPSTNLYEYALDLARQEKYDQARTAFEELLEQHPQMCKVWVSYAQMERRLSRTHDPLRLQVARQILQKGLQMNPDSGCLAQAWGLMELQKGNFWAAVRLLERSVDLDPVLKPVLKWKPVSIARMTVQTASSSRSGRWAAARVSCASAGAGIAGNTASSSPAAANGGKGQLSHDVGSPASGASSKNGGSCMSSL